MLVSVFTEVCNYHHSVLLEHFINPQKPCAYEHSLPLPLSLETWSSTGDLPIWGISHRENLTLVGFCAQLLS